MEKREPSYTVGGNVNWYNHYGKQYGPTSENYTLNYHMNKQSHSWAYIQTKLEDDTCTYMFIAAVFTIAKTWKQPKHPLTGEWIKKIWYIYKMEYCPTIKKNKRMPFAATWMELEILIVGEISRKGKDKYHMISLIFGIQYMAQKIMDL